jgi:ectoine hydroxylase-related dioxygenase (phytanoyl-CoA dioxygenase family)
MDAGQRYQFDLSGFLTISQALSPDELAAARMAVEALMEAGQPFRHIDSPALATLPFHPKLWPIVLELTNGKPMMRHSFGIHNPPLAAGAAPSAGGPLHCNRESHRSSVVGSPSLARYEIRDGHPYCTDFVCFVYLDTVEPGDGGLMVIPGSMKSQFERPAEMFGAYGRANAEPPEGIAPKGHERPSAGSEWRTPEHALNLCPAAGDIVVMSEGTSHAGMPWLSTERHRRALALRFKPQHTGLPDDGLDEAAVLALPPELRELRASAGAHHTKAIAKMPLPIALSPPAPSTQPLLDTERCAAKYLKTEPADQDIMRRYPPAPAAGRPGSVGLTAEQRYLMDLNGYLHIKGVLTPVELEAARAAVSDYESASPVPEGFEVPEGGRGNFPNGFAFSPALGALAWHPKLRNAILELTDGKPKLSSGTLMVQDSSYGGGGLHCAREDHGWDSARWETVAGRCHCDNFVVFPYLDDVHEGDGGLVVLRGSHKCSFERPGQTGSDLPHLYESSPDAWMRHGLPHGAVNVAPVAAGDVLILPEATVHAVLPWTPSSDPDRLRRFLVLRFGPQYSGSQPLETLPAAVSARLSDTTRELMAYAHITHTKPLAMDYRISGAAAPRL